MLSPDPIGMEWADEFLPHMRERWEPGQHFSLCALTGAGKSTFVAGLLELRRWVGAFDVKGGDEILAGFKWPRLAEWPGVRSMEREVRRAVKENRPYRCIVGPVVHREQDRPKLARTLSESITGMFEMGGWTMYIDELQVAADRRMMNLSGQIAGLLVSARQPKRISVVSSFQAPSWVPTEAVRQPHWFAVTATRDREMVARLAEVMGRDRAEIQGAMNGLEEYCWLVVDRNPRHPIIVTKPRKAAAA